MKLALLLPGYIESPDYLHLVVIDEGLSGLGYKVVRVDPCLLWATGEVENYILTNYIKQIKEIIDSYESDNLEEVVLVGHSLGASAAILVGADDIRVTKIVCLSPAVVLDKSREKWNESGIRCSKKDLPTDPNVFREFCVPLSHLDDRKQYSVTEALHDLTIPTMFLFGSDDPSADEIQKVVDSAQISKVVRIENMSHDFRQSLDLCNRVADEVKKFLLD
jgi:pimeloyl-ACP methyl ester carboxylesterase